MNTRTFLIIIAAVFFRSVVALAQASPLAPVPNNPAAAEDGRFGFRVNLKANQTCDPASGPASMTILDGKVFIQCGDAPTELEIGNKTLGELAQQLAVANTKFSFQTDLKDLPAKHLEEVVAVELSTTVRQFAVRRPMAVISFDAGAVLFLRTFQEESDQESKLLSPLGTQFDIIGSWELGKADILRTRLGLFNRAGKEVTNSAEFAELVGSTSRVVFGATYDRVVSESLKEAFSLSLSGHGSWVSGGRFNVRSFLDDVYGDTVAFDSMTVVATQMFVNEIIPEFDLFLDGVLQVGAGDAGQFAIGAGIGYAASQYSVPDVFVLSDTNEKGQRIGLVVTKDINTDHVLVRLRFNWSLNQIVDVRAVATAWAEDVQGTTSVLLTLAAAIPLVSE